LRLQKELATEKERATSRGGSLNKLCNNGRMNGLLVGLPVRTGQLVPETKGQVLDFDNQFIPADKYDSKKGYKKKNGYFPGIASIDNRPVYVEWRNGNSNVKFGQAGTLKRTYALLRENGIKVATAVWTAAPLPRRWSLPCFGGERTYRYVVSREKRGDGQGDLFTGDSFTYRAIITDNTEMGDAEVVHFYNARGNSERLFDEMNNDFLWKKMPFSFLNENTVFLIMTAICRN
jgi:hypothetical protein